MHADFSERQAEGIADAAITLKEAFGKRLPVRTHRKAVGEFIAMENCPAS